MAGTIPPRDSSKYAYQYQHSVDSRRMLEIFLDSNRLALTSKSPATANDRFALAVETYYQLLSLGLNGADQAGLGANMQELADVFPTKVALNEVSGLRDKARKLKTPRKKLELLERARHILELAIGKHAESSALEEALTEVKRELADV